MFNFNLRLVLIALAIGLMFAACGGNKKQENAETTPENTKQETSVQEKTSDNTTIEGRLAKAGLTLNAIKPDNRFAEAGLHREETGVKLYLTGQEEVTAEDKERFFTKLRDAIASISDDKKVYNAYYGLGEPKELSLEGTNWKPYYMIAQWSYQFDSKWITLTIGFPTPAEKEGFSHCASLDFLYSKR